MCPLLSSRPLLLALTALTVLPLGALQAACPRSRGEQTRRIVPSVLLLPAAPFILTHQPRTTPLPPPGAAVRVSHRDAAGRTQFVRGTLVALDSSAVTLATDGNPAERLPMETVQCVQVPRRSAAAGAATGFTAGALAGITTAAGWAVFYDDPKLGPLAAFGVGSVVYGVVGSVTGTVVGAALRATSWDTVLDRTR
jgi:hypothetical protein